MPPADQLIETINKTNEKIDRVSEKIGTLSETVAVLNTSFNNHVVTCKDEITEMNSKLGRDYVRINKIEQDKAINNGIKKHDKELSLYKTNKTKFMIYVAAFILSAVISINAIWGIAAKIKTNGDTQLKPVITTENIRK